MDKLYRQDKLKGVISAEAIKRFIEDRFYNNNKTILYRGKEIAFSLCDDDNFYCYLAEDEGSGLFEEVGER